MKRISHFGTVMRELRQSKGLSQEDLADKMDISSNSHISRLESGKKQPSLDTVFRLAHIFGVNASELVRMIEEREKGD